MLETQDDERVRIAKRVSQRLSACSTLSVFVLLYY
jgi:hypothetical protein